MNFKRILQMGHFEHGIPSKGSSHSANANSRSSNFRTTKSKRIKKKKIPDLAFIMKCKDPSSDSLWQPSDPTGFGSVSTDDQTSPRIWVNNYGSEVVSPNFAFDPQRIQGRIRLGWVGSVWDHAFSALIAETANKLQQIGNRKIARIRKI